MVPKFTRLNRLYLGYNAHDLTFTLPFFLKRYYTLRGESFARRFAAEMQSLLPAPAQLQTLKKWSPLHEFQPAIR